MRPTLKRAPLRPFWELPSISQPLPLHQPRGPGSSPRFEGRSRFRFAFGPAGSHCYRLWPSPDTQQWPLPNRERESFCHTRSHLLNFALGFSQPQLAGKPSVSSLSANLNLYCFSADGLHASCRHLELKQALGSAGVATLSSVVRVSKLSGFAQHPLQKGRSL